VHTYQSALALIDTTVPAHLAADLAVPVLTGPQAQGDLIVYPADRVAATGWKHVPPSGVQLVRGEATGNTHWLHQGLDCRGVEFARSTDELIIGYLRVPGGESAMLLHTDEHGANGIGPGLYVISGKREQASIVRRVAD